MDTFFNGILKAFSTFAQILSDVRLDTNFIG